MGVYPSHPRSGEAVRNDHLHNFIMGRNDGRFQVLQYL